MEEQKANDSMLKSISKNEIEIVKEPAEVNKVYAVKEQFSNIAEVKTSLMNIAKVGEVLKTTLKEGVDYGRIPKSPKPFLFGAGAEKIAIMLGVTPHYEIIQMVNDLTKTPFIVSYTIKCTVSVINSNGDKVIINEGFGAANNKERSKQSGDQARMTNDLLKIAKKRSFVDAIKSLAAASDVFSQDEESVQKVEPLVEEKKKLEIYRAAYAKFNINTEDKNEKQAVKEWIGKMFQEWNKQNATTYNGPLAKMTISDFQSWLSFLKTKIQMHYYDDVSNEVVNEQQGLNF